VEKIVENPGIVTRPIAARAREAWYFGVAKEVTALLRWHLLCRIRKDPVNPAVLPGRKFPWSDRRRSSVHAKYLG
jgi:hypothetical protein